MVSDIEDRMHALERQLDGLEVALERSIRTTDRLVADVQRTKTATRDFRRSIEDRIDLLDRAFGAVHSALIGHATDPDAHKKEGQP